jgi:peptidoglycan/LPS O-acetylase OafA/YrhL
MKSNLAVRVVSDHDYGHHIAFMVLIALVVVIVLAQLTFALIERQSRRRLADIEVALEQADGDAPRSSSRLGSD